MVRGIHKSVKFISNHMRKTARKIRRKKMVGGSTRFGNLIPATEAFLQALKDADASGDVKESGKEGAGEVAVSASDAKEEVKEGTQPRLSDKLKPGAAEETGVAGGVRGAGAAKQPGETIGAGAVKQPGETVSAERVTFLTNKDEKKRTQ